jgi:hypothetical protein
MGKNNKPQQHALHILVYLCLLLLLSTGSIPSQQIQTNTSKDQWFYVGGSGPGNYTRIQEALDVAQDGDTVFVYDDHSPYIEELTINTSVNLIGEQKETTVIMWGYQWAIAIYADQALVTGFTIHCLYHGYGVYLVGNQNTLRDNIFENSTIDSLFIFSRDNLITHNQFSGAGISLINAFRNNISFNTINGCDPAIGLWTSNAENTFYMNNIMGSRMGVILMMSSKNSFLRNNFLNNSIQVRFARGIPYELYSKIELIFDPYSNNAFQLGMHYRVFGLNKWDGNYWDGSGLSPHPIFGRRGYPGMFTIDNVFYLPTMINFDWHPAKKPYEIPVMR